MNRDELKELLSTLPEEEEIADRAARARRRALARFDERPRAVRSGLGWTAAVAGLAVVLVAAAMLHYRPHRAPAPAAPAAVVQEQGVQKMYWVLSDGTRVHWTFHKKARM